MPSIFESTLVPTQGSRNRGVSDADEWETDTIGLVATVTTAGPLAVQFHGSSTTVIYNLALGTHELRGNFSKVLSTGSTAVLTGGAGATMVQLRFRPYTLKH